jgi:hypothetical protein
VKISDLTGTTTATLSVVQLHQLRYPGSIECELNEVIIKYSHLMECCLVNSQQKGLIYQQGGIT